MKLGPLVLCASLATGCIAMTALRGDESRHQSTKEEDAVYFAFVRCFRELEGEAGYTEDPVTRWNNVRFAIKSVQDAQAIANADRSIAERTWPFPWNRGERRAP